VAWRHRTDEFRAQTASPAADRSQTGRRGDRSHADRAAARA
jgi:hypothetical protein